MQKPSVVSGLLCASLGYGVLTTPAKAAIFTVTNTADSGTGSLRRAISEANKSPQLDQIRFALPAAQLQHGVWTITLKSELPVVMTQLRIVEPGASRLTIRTEAAKASLFRIHEAGDGGSIAVYPGIPNQILSGLTLRGSRGDGAVVSVRGKLAFEDVRFIANSAAPAEPLQRAGGALSGYGGEYSFKNCVFERNSAPSGGAVQVWAGGSATFLGCTFRTNTATGVGRTSMGGAILSDGNLLLENCGFEGNEAKWGSAIFAASGNSIDAVNGSRTVSINHCNFDAHRPPANIDAVNPALGTIYNEGADVTITAATFRNNYMSAGGALFNGDGQLNVRRSTFVGNSAQTGSVLQVAGGGASLFNCTLVGNSPLAGNTIDHFPSTGGTIDSAATPKTLIANCTFDRNAVRPYCFEFGTGPGAIELLNTIVNIHGQGRLNNTGGGQLTSLGNNLVYGPGNPVLGGPRDISGQDPRLDPRGLRDNGGPTPTLALQPDSPGIDAGSNVVLMAPYYLGVDQRGTGFPRKVDHAVDIGAVEMQENTITPNRPSGNAS